MVIKSIKFGIVLFLVMFILDWIFKPEVHWQYILFGTIIASFAYFGFQWRDKKNDTKYPDYTKTPMV